MKRLLLVLSVLVITISNTEAQKSVEKGDRLFSELAFVKALDAYMSSDLENAEVMLKVAETNRRLQRYTQAQIWFEKSYEYQKSNPVALLHYAEVVAIHGDYEKAKKLYEEVLALDSNNDLAKAGFRSCEEANMLLQNANLFEVNSVDFNTAAYDFSPVYYEDGLMFSSDRDFRGQRIERFAWTGSPFIDMYYVVDGSKNGPTLMKGELNSAYNDGPLCFNDDESEMIFTTNYKKSDEKILNLKLMYSTWDSNENEWSKAKGFSFNSPSYNVAHPSLSMDGNTLYFASDMPGGLGGTDIWKSTRTSKSGEWSKPVNMGSEINTEGEDKFPYVDKDGVLYFASNGHVGLGGLDIYRAAYDAEDKVYHIWNLGAPLNSSKDDFGLILNKSGVGYFTSARDGGKGYDDIYKTKVIGNYVEVFVISKATGDVLPNAKVEFVDGNNTIVLYSNEDGHLHFPAGSATNYVIHASEENHNPLTKNLSTIGFQPGATIYEVIELDKNYNINLSGLVLEEKSGLPIEASYVIIENTSMNYSDTLVTGADGLVAYNLAPNITYRLTALKEGYKGSSVEFNTNDIDSGVVKQTLILTEGERVYNVAFNNIYFDYDKATLRGSSIAELRKMMEILERSSELRVEISAHTDCRGSDSYNMSLSDRRAKSVVNYLIENGIDKSRMVPKGYGETRLRNGCSNNVDCTEDQHQQNRRVEFAVIDKNNKVIMKGQN